MWINFLRYAGRAAITLGWHNTLLWWVRDRLDRVETKLLTKIEAIRETIDEVDDNLDD